jgi:hypothetical protein
MWEILIVPVKFSLARSATKVFAKTVMASQLCVTNVTRFAIVV